MMTTTTTWGEMMRGAVEGEPLSLEEWIEAAELAASIDGEIGGWLALAGVCQKSLELSHNLGVVIGPETRAVVWELGATADYAERLANVR